LQIYNYPSDASFQQRYFRCLFG